MSVSDKKRIEFLEKEVSKAMDAINLLVEKNDKQREAYFATEKLYFDQKAITELAVKGLQEISWQCEKAEFNSLAGAGYFKDFIMNKADDIISEINKLTQK